MNAFSSSESPLEGWYEGQRLHLAATDGELDELKQLLKTDYAKLINTFDDTGATPLSLAASNGHVDAVKLLIEAGADVNAHDENQVGDTALGKIAGEASFEMIEILVQTGANPNIRGWMQLNALDRVKERRRKEGQKVFGLLQVAARKFKI